MFGGESLSIAIIRNDSASLCLASWRELRRGLENANGHPRYAAATLLPLRAGRMGVSEAVITPPYRTWVLSFTA